MQYNLLYEPWIPVIDSQGQLQKLGLIALFQRASDLREIAHNNPLVVASVYRLCLAILFRIRTVDSQRAFRKQFFKGDFPAELFEYLESEQGKEAFDLFSESRPFFQTPGFTKDKASSVKKLSPEFATANNKTLFSHLHDQDDFALKPDEAALRLLVCQYFSLGGGISGSSQIYGKHPNFSNAPLVGGAVFYIRGNNLYQTLVLNLYVKDSALLENNKPVWELPVPTTLKPQEMFGISHYLSWPSRHVRLLPDEQGKVANIYLAQGYETPKAIGFEPYFTMRVKKDGKGHIPLRLNFERDFWRDTLSILGFASSEDDRELTEEFAAGIANVRTCYDELGGADITHLDCLAFCLDNNKANPLCWFNQSLPVYFAYLREAQGGGYQQALRSAIQYAELTASNLNRACRVFATQLVMEGSRAEDVTRLVDAMKSSQYYWPELEQAFQHFYRKLAECESHYVEQISSLQKNWNSSVRMAARKALEKAQESMTLSTSRAFKAYAFSKKSLEENLTGDKTMETKFDNTTIELVAKLSHFQHNKEVSRAALASLKRCISDDPGQFIKAFRYFEGLLCEETNRWNIRAYCWCAGLFALNQQHSSQLNRSLGYSLNRLKQVAGMGESFDNRFELLLDAQSEQLPVVLRSFFQMLSQHNIPVDYRHLIHDVKRWNSPKKMTQLKWAREFWAPAPKTDSEQ